MTTPTITIGDPSSNATWSPVAVQAFAIWDFSGSGIVQGASGSGGVFPRFQSSSGAQPVVRQGNQFDRGRGGLRANIVIGYFFNESDKPRFVAFHLFIDPKTNNAVPISVLYGDARADVPGTLVWVGLVADFPPLQITNGDAVLNTPNIATGRVGGTTLAADGTNRVVDFTFHLALVRQ